MPRFPQRIWLAAFLVAWAVDFLFWGKPAGISFLLFVVIALTAGFLLARIEKIQPVLLSIVLSVAVLLLAGATLLRAEPLTRLMNGFLSLVGLVLLVRTFRTGGWIRFRAISYLLIWIDMLVVGLSRAASLPLAPKTKGNQSRLRSGLRHALPVIRGILLAIPVVILLAALLASADLIFADQLNGFLKNFDLDRLPEYVLRFFLILMMAYLFAGLYLQALLPRGWVAFLPGDEKLSSLPDLAQPVVGSSEIASSTSNENQAKAGDSGVEPDRQAEEGRGVRFLGATEAFVVLGSVNLLFAFFVAIQFRYLFGGQTNITASGYTFSEYARRGFFELVSVAVISLVLYLTLNAITRRSSANQERAFVALSALQVGLVLVILVSAFQRLRLYEDAYGFTRLRMYTHIFIPWLGLLLLGTILLQFIRREQYFGALLILTVFGFSMSFGIVNVDRLIARLNIERARSGAELDGSYLLNLSDDILPEVVTNYRQPGQPKQIQDTLGGVLACRVYWISQEEPQPWQSYLPGQAAARLALAGVDLSPYPIRQSDTMIYVPLDGGPFQCSRSDFID